MFKKCVICGREFEAKIKWQTICSDECRKIYKREYQRKFRSSLAKDIPTAESGRMKSVNCGCWACGKSFERNFANERFCSDKCRTQYFGVEDYVA